MSNDFEHVEKELKKLYSCDVEYTRSIEIQKIVSHCGFSLTELCKIFKGNIFAGPKTGMLSSNPNFHGAVLTIGSNVEQGYKKLRWIYCYDTRHHPPTLYVLGFPAINELKHYTYLKRADKLKAFL